MSEFEYRPSDPIEVRNGIRAIKEWLGGNQPNHILMNRQTVVAMVNHVKREIRRAEKFLRKPLLSGNFEKRQRQKRTGKAHRVIEKRRWYVGELPTLRDQFERWSELAGDDADEQKEQS